MQMNDICAFIDCLFDYMAHIHELFHEYEIILVTQQQDLQLNRIILAKFVRKPKATTFDESGFLIECKISSKFTQ